MRKLDLAAAFGLCLAVSSPALGASCPSGTIYATGFENPPFIAGTPLVGQDGWVGSPPLSPNAAVIATDLFFVGLQSVRVRGQDLVHQDFINTLTGGYYDAIGSYRKPVTCDVTAAFPIVRLQAKVRIDGPTTPPGADAHACVKGQFTPCNNFFSASLAVRGGSTVNGTAGIGELALSSDGKAYGYSGDDNVPTFLDSRPAKLEESHTLAVNTDLVNKKFAFCLDGKFVGGPFSFPATADLQTLIRGTIVVYTAPDTPQYQKNNFVAHADNFSIATLAAAQSLTNCD